MNVLDLFSGIGGFSLGLERAGMHTVAFCEIEPYCRAVLAKHWPGVPCYPDIRELSAARLAADGISADVICGGFPCQDVSTAGDRAGLEGQRSGLWFEYKRLIREIRPRFVIVENVTGLLSLGMGTVLGDLASLGYDAEWHCISAAAVGAPHERDRVWIIAHAEKITGLYGLLVSGLRAVPNRVSDWKAWAREQWPETEPLICRVNDGIPDRVGRTGSCGNAVYPKIPEIIGRAIMSTAVGESVE
jgi:DNA (cytosine-5)-methyltransferase 1